MKFALLPLIALGTALTLTGSGCGGGGGGSSSSGSGSGTTGSSSNDTALNGTYTGTWSETSASGQTGLSGTITMTIDSTAKGAVTVSGTLQDDYEGTPETAQFPAIASYTAGPPEGLANLTFNSDFGVFLEAANGNNPIEVNWTNIPLSLQSNGHLTTPASQTPPMYNGPDQPESGSGDYATGENVNIDVVKSS